MAYRTRKAYRLEKQILFNNCNTNNLYGTILSPTSIAKIGQDRRVFEGSVWTNNGVLGRSKLISPYTAGDTTVIVNYPYPFAVGDVLYEIGDKDENLIAEAQRINNATAQVLGTVTAIDPTANYQVTEITPGSIVAGDIFSLEFEGQTASFTATTTNVADVTAGLYKALTSGLRSHHSILESLKIIDDGTKLVLQAKEPAEIFTVSGFVTGTSTLDVVVTTSVGALTITPDAGNNSHSIGAKVGTIDQVPLGVIASGFYLTDSDGMDITADFAAYDMANINKAALPYWDGQLAQLLNTIKLFPPYGA